MDRLTDIFGGRDFWCWHVQSHDGIVFYAVCGSKSTPQFKVNSYSYLQPFSLTFITRTYWATRRNSYESNLKISFGSHFDLKGLPRKQHVGIHISQTSNLDRISRTSQGPSKQHVNTSPPSIIFPPLMMAPPSIVTALCQRQHLWWFLHIQWLCLLGASDYSETLAPQWWPL